MSKYFNINKEEYSILREELMLRTGWHMTYTRNAIIMSTSIWASSFALINYFSDKDFFHIVTFAFLFPILMMYPLSFKIYENYVNFSNIPDYLKKFHEKPISENDGTFFSWETAHGDLINSLRKNNPKIAKTMNKSNEELTYLSVISLLLFLLVSVLNNRRDYDFLTVSIGAGIIGILLTIEIYYKSSYKCLEKLFKEAEKFWDSYPEEEKKAPVA